MRIAIAQTVDTRPFSFPPAKRDWVRASVYNREREYPTVNMSPESNVTFDHSHVTFHHSHVMHVHVHWSICSFQACDSPKTYSTGMYRSSTLSFSIIYSWYEASRWCAASIVIKTLLNM